MLEPHLVTESLPRIIRVLLWRTKHGFPARQIHDWCWLARFKERIQLLFCHFVFLSHLPFLLLAFHVRIVPPESQQTILSSHRKRGENP